MNNDFYIRLKRILNDVTCYAYIIVLGISWFLKDYDCATFPLLWIGLNYIFLNILIYILYKRK